MRTYIFISKTFLVSVLLFLLGVCCIYVGKRSSEKYEEVLNISELNRESCVEGKYVTGTIDTYVVQVIESGVGKEYSGQSEQTLNFFSKYDTYTIPVADNQYIRVMVKSREKVGDLENYTQGEGEGVAFEGVIKTSDSINTEWYEKVEGFEMEQMIADFVLMETDIQSKKKLFGPGIAAIILSILLSVSSGVVYRSTITRDEE